MIHSATLTIAGTAMQLQQVTLRRSADAAELDMQIAGRPDIAVGAAVAVVIDGVSIEGVVASFTPAARSINCVASVTPATGSGVYAPDHIHSRSSGTLRGDIDFSVRPGDTFSGLVIRSCTHTLGASSPAFTEVRF